MIKKLFIFYSLLCCGSAFGQTLVAHWTFSSGQAIDSVNGLNGSVYNCTPVAGANGTTNGALQFNGVNSKVDVPYNPLMNTSTFTIQALVKVIGFNTDQCETSSIIWRGLDGNADHYNMVITDNMYNACGSYDSSRMRFSSGTAGYNPNAASGYQYANGGIAYNQWNCVTATYDGTTLKQYLNGVLRYSLNWPNQFVNGTDPIAIGYYLQGVSLGYPYYFKGVIDDIKLWNGALTLAAVNESCSATQTPPPSTTVKEVTAAMVASIYPNPFADRINVQINLDQNAAVQLSLYNTMGQKIMERQVSGINGENNYSLDAGTLPSGIYWLQMTDGKTKTTTKLVKK